MLVPLALSVALLGLVAATDECYNPKTDFYELMGTRTAYELVHGHDDLRILKDPKCKPLQMWVLARHGTKYPENKDMPKLLDVVNLRDRIIKNHEQGGDGQLCELDVENLRKWQLNPAISNRTNEELAPQGEKDLEDFAKRLKAAYPELLQFDPKTFKPTDIVYKSTNRQRTIKSMEAFNAGIFGERVNSIAATKASDRDTVLMPHKNCKAWNLEYVAKGLNGQRNEFVKGPEVHSILTSVSRRLGFNETLDYVSVKAAYDMCRYEVAWYPTRVSTWCSIFKRRDLEIFEYSEDLDFYYCCGPGREMSAKLGCKALADMLSHFKQIETGNLTNQPKGIFYFGHSMTLQTTLAALKIGKEETPFTAKSFASAAKRKYHVSKLGPFATNIVAVMHRCEDAQQPTYKVSVHVAEAPAPIAVCKDGLCEWEALKKEYGPAADSCSFDFCGNDQPNAGVASVSFGIGRMLLLALVALLVRG